MLWVALISICLVFLVLVLLVWVMKLFGYVFTRRQDAATAAANKSAVVPGQIHDEEIAAIATALKLYRSALHDRGVRSADHHEHQACLFALEFENSRFNPASRKEIELK